MRVQTKKFQTCIRDFKTSSKGGIIMQISKKLLLWSLLVVGLSVVPGFSQSDSVKEFSIAATGGAVPDVSIVLRGDGIDVTGFYTSPEAFSLCSPCQTNERIRFARNFLGINFRGSGTIGGVSYQTLYFGFGFDLTQQQETPVPLTWRKNLLRVGTPMTLTGSIGAWTNASDVGNVDRAIYYQSNIRLTGQAGIVLAQQLFGDNSSRRMFMQRSLTYTFTHQSDDAEAEQ